LPWDIMPRLVLELRIILKPQGSGTRRLLHKGTMMHKSDSMLFPNLTLRCFREKSTRTSRMPSWSGNIPRLRIARPQLVEPHGERMIKRLSASSVSFGRLLSFISLIGEKEPRRRRRLIPDSMDLPRATDLVLVPVLLVLLQDLWEALRENIGGSLVDLDLLILGLRIDGSSRTRVYHSPLRSRLRPALIDDRRRFKPLLLHR